MSGKRICQWQSHMRCCMVRMALCDTRYPIKALKPGHTFMLFGYIKGVHGDVVTDWTDRNVVPYYKGTWAKPMLSIATSQLDWFRCTACQWLVARNHFIGNQSDWAGE